MAKKNIDPVHPNEFAAQLQQSKFARADELVADAREDKGRAPRVAAVKPGQGVFVDISV
jgi:hypothetical protein